MTRPIDEAYVEIKPDVDDFDRDVQRELNGTFKNVERKLDDLTETIENAFDRLVVVLDANFGDLAHSIEKSFDSVERDARGAADTIDDVVSAGSRGAKRAIDDLADKAEQDFDRIERDAKKAGVGIASAFGSGLVSGAQQMFNNVADLGNKIRGVASAGGPILGIVKILAMASLVPIVLGLGGALVDLSAILLAVPAAVGVAAAAFIPLMIAIKGVSGAMSAFIEGDMKEYNAQLKKLTPDTRAAVREMTALVEPFKQLSRNVTNAFWGQLIGFIKPLATTLIPVLDKGLSRVAVSLGAVGAYLADLFSQDDILEAFGDLFETTFRVIQMFGYDAVDLIATLIGVMEHGLPFVERMAMALRSGLENVSTWLSNAMASGDFEKWLEQSFSIISDLWELLTSVGSLLGTLFGNAGDEGQSFIQSINEAVQKLDEFFKSAEGQETLQRTLDTLKFIGSAIVAIVEGYGFLMGALNAVFNFVTSIPNAIATAWGATSSFFVNLWNTVSTFVIGAVTGAWAHITGFFSALPGRIGGFLSSLPGILRQAALAAFDAFFYAVGFGAVRVIQLVQAMPGIIWGIITSLWHGAVALFWIGVRGVIAAAIWTRTELPRLFKEAWDRGRQMFIDGINAVVNFAMQLPNRVWSALVGVVSRINDVANSARSAAFNIGVDILKGMVNGIQSWVGNLVSAAKRAVGEALQGARDALLSRSPSRRWAELGQDSMAGYAMGFDQEADNAIREMKSTINHTVTSTGGRQSAQSSSANATAGFGGTIIVQLGDEQITNPVVRIIERNPQPVALAVEQGNTNLNRRR